MGLLFWIWFSGFVICFVTFMYIVYRLGRFTLYDIYDFLPLCVGSWVTLICETFRENYEDKVLMSWADDANEDEEE